MSATPFSSSLTPLEVLLLWPRAKPLAALLSSGLSPFSRWSYLALPSTPLLIQNSATLHPSDPRITLRRTFTRHARSASTPHPDEPPFQSGWIGHLSYDLGRVLEPRSGLIPKDAQGNLAPPADRDRAWPLAQFHRVTQLLAYDHANTQWWLVGDWPRAEPPAFLTAPPKRKSQSAFALGPISSATGQDRFEAAVERVLAYIHAGDAYQVNLAHRLSAPFRGSARALFHTLAASGQPWYGSYLESTDRASEHGILAPRRRALLSLSPETFLSYDPASRTVTTRPMKGTRPLPDSPDLARDTAAELNLNPKDRAELAMIIDLMRNDLGRVCDLGSVRVAAERDIESHASGVLQATATITGRLRDDLDLADLLCEAFPPGSVTGAPKIRAMQIIDELEPVRRGPYCGCIGYVADDGHAAFAVTIRTASIAGHGDAASTLGRRITPGQRTTYSLDSIPDANLDDFAKATLDYSVGAGIVADSSPRAEWLETLAKAKPILALAAPAPAPAPEPDPTPQSTPDPSP